MHAHEAWRGAPRSSASRISTRWQQQCQLAAPHVCMHVQVCSVCCCSVVMQGGAGGARRWARRARGRHGRLERCKGVSVGPACCAYVCTALQLQLFVCLRRMLFWGDGCVAARAGAGASKQIKYGGHGGARRRRIRPRGLAPARGQTVQRQRIMRAHCSRFWSFRPGRLIVYLRDPCKA